MLIPPEEALWVKYSPHGEAPLSGVGSMAMHVLVVVLLLLCWWLGRMFFSPPAHDLEIGVVRMPGGGGGSRTGEGDAPGIGTGGNEEVGEEDPDKTAITPDLVKRPPLDVKEAAAVDAKFADDPAARAIMDSNT